MTGRVILVLGGARSGKSRHALARAEALPGPHVFVATAQAHDAEMRERIDRHRAERDARWTTVEAPLDLVEALDAWRGRGAMLLVDCLTLWTSNLMLADRDVGAATQALCEALAGHDGTVILVANEVGLGIVPENALVRRFRDEAGRMNQAVAAIADEVLFVAAGLPLRLK